MSVQTRGKASYGSAEDIISSRTAVSLRFSENLTSTESSITK